MADKSGVTNSGTGVASHDVTRSGGCDASAATPRGRSGFKISVTLGLPFLRHARFAVAGAGVPARFKRDAKMLPVSLIHEEFLKLK